MRPRARFVATAIVSAFLAGAARAEAQQLKIENVYPRQLIAGQTSTVHIVVATLADIGAPELTPSDGVRISGVTRGESFQGALTWFSLTVDVAADASPGERLLSVQLPAGRTAGTPLALASHAPRISGLRILSAAANPPAVKVEVAIADAEADLGDSPPVGFLMTCDRMPLPGVVRGTAIRPQDRTTFVQATLPGVPPGTTASSQQCDVAVRVADAAGIESNTLSRRIDLSGPFPSPDGPVNSVFRSASVSHPGELTEIVSRESRFALTFPAFPQSSYTTWFSQFGAALPAQVLTVDKDGSHYSATIVDYTHVERALVERSRSCPAGANTCQGIADWGVGYWKTDIRGALLFAISKFVARDARVTSLIWNGIALVQGVEMRLTNPDDSRTFASIYMHENRLVIVEATVPKNAPPPVAFNESLNWLDAQGQPVRYQSTYVNVPDVPKPLPRGAAAAAAAAAQR